MNIRELQEGNYCQQEKGRQKKVSYHCIEKIISLDDKYSIETEQGEQIEDVKAIELSSDILKKSGFRKNSNTYTRKVDGYSIQWIDMPQFKRSLLIRNIKTEDYLFFYRIDFVHELQNAFQLFTGQKLNITL